MAGEAEMTFGPSRCSYVCLFCVLTLVLSAGCAPSPDTIATVGSDEMKIADLDASLLALPESERQIPAGSDSNAWLESKIRRLALERVLESSPEAEDLRNSAEFATRRPWLRSAMLLSALSSEIVLSATPSEEEMKRAMAGLAAVQRNEPLLNFQHIYFRLDAKTPRERTDIRISGSG